MSKQPKGYPAIHIINSTGYRGAGKIFQASFLCGDYGYNLPAHGYYMGPRRQLCLLTQITARLETPGGTIHATPYKSSGTSFSKFAVIQIRSDPLRFEVIRRANSAEDKKEADSTKQTAARKAVKKGAATAARKALSAKSAKKAGSRKSAKAASNRKK